MRTRYGPKNPYPGVSQRPSGRWRVQKVQQRSKPGRKAGPLRTFGTFDEYGHAERLAVRIDEALDRDEDTSALVQGNPRSAEPGTIAADDATLADVVPRWIAMKRRRSRRHYVPTRALQMAENHLLPSFDGPIRGINANEVQDWAYSMAERPHCYSEGTVRQMLVFLGQLIDCWRREVPGRQHLFPENPARDIQTKPPIEPRGPVVDLDHPAWTPEEYARFRACCRPIYQDFFDTLAGTGTRDGEAGGITQEQAGQLLISVEKQGGEGVKRKDVDEHGIMQGVKNDQSLREIPIPTFVGEALRRRLSAIPAEHRNPSAPLFLGSTGGLDFLDRARAEFKRAARRAGLWPAPKKRNGLPPVELKLTPHFLRSVFVTWVANNLVGKGMIAEVQLNYYAGHRGDFRLPGNVPGLGVSRTSRNRYQRPSPEAFRIIAAEVDRAFGSAIINADRVDLVTLSEARAQLGISQPTLDQRMAQTAITPIPDPRGGRRRVVTVGDIERLLARQEQPPSGYIPGGVACRRLGITTRLLIRRIKEEEIRGKQIGRRRMWWCDEEDVAAMEAKMHSVTKEEAARLLGCTVERVDQLVASRRLHTIYVGGVERIPRDSISTERRRLKWPPGWVTQSEAAKRLRTSPGRLRTLARDPESKLHVKKERGAVWYEEESLLEEEKRLRPPAMVPLKQAARASNIRYDILWMACCIGHIDAVKRAGKWYVDRKALESYVPRSPVTITGGRQDIIGFLSHWDLAQRWSVKRAIASNYCKLAALPVVVVPSVNKPWVHAHYYSPAVIVEFEVRMAKESDRWKEIVQRLPS